MLDVKVEKKHPPLSHFLREIRAQRFAQLSSLEHVSNGSLIARLELMLFCWLLAPRLAPQLFPMPIPGLMPGQGWVNSFGDMPAGEQLASPAPAASPRTATYVTALIVGGMGAGFALGAVFTVLMTRSRCSGGNVQRGRAAVRAGGNPRDSKRRG